MQLNLFYNRYSVLNPLEKFGTILLYNIKKTIMIKYSYYVSPDKQSSLFQQHNLQGRVHARDYGFYMRKLAFMEQQKQTTPEKKEDNRYTNNG